MRIQAVKFLSTSLAVLEVCWILFPLRNTYEPKWKFWHFFSFAIHYGSQFWMTFIAGMAMFMTLPRYWFGEGQKVLFPLYFALSLVMSTMTLATYVQLHDSKSIGFIEIISLGTALLSAIINAFYLGDKIVEYSTKRFGLEKGSGTADKIGFVDLTEMRKNKEYLVADKTFRFYHHLSWVSNMSSFLANTVYLYSLSSHYL